MLTAATNILSRASRHIAPLRALGVATLACGIARGAAVEPTSHSLAALLAPACCVAADSRAALLAHASTQVQAAAASANTSTTKRAATMRRTGPAGMVWIPGGEFAMGGTGTEARADEFPVHQVHLHGFWMDITEVTNAQFKAFVAATGYVTTAEKQPDWEELKKQLPPGTPPPAPGTLAAGALVFIAPGGPVPLDDVSQWWRYTAGASWRQPQGPGHPLTAADDSLPVVEVSWDDAVAYCNWAHKRLPTEAEWEFAARGGKQGETYAWGSELHPGGRQLANLFQGDFPYRNTAVDGFQFSAPVKSYPPNGYGLYDMIGNVWEWCADWYRADYYATLAASGSIVNNPQGPATSLDLADPYAPKRVQRGGSFLCNEQYCASYRPSARMKTSPDTGQLHAGFRCVMDERD